MALVVLASGVGAGLGGYAPLPAAGVLAGFGYALNNVGTNVAVAGAVRPRRRTVSLATRSSGILLMSAVSAAVAPVVADRWGWEWVFGGLGVGAAVMAFAALGVLPGDRGEPHELLQRRSHSLPKGFVWFPIAAFCLIAGAQPLLSWTVPYAEESLGLSSTWAGILVGASSAVGAVAMVTTGVGADRLGSQRRMRLLVVLVAGTGVSCLLLAAGQMLGLGVAMVGVLGGIVPAIRQHRHDARHRRGPGGPGRGPRHRRHDDRLLPGRARVAGGVRGLRGQRRFLRVGVAHPRHPAGGFRRGLPPRRADRTGGLKIAFAWRWRVAGFAVPPGWFARVDRVSGRGTSLRSTMSNAVEPSASGWAEVRRTERDAAPTEVANVPDARVAHCPADLLRARR